MRIVRTDCEINTPCIDEGLRRDGHELLLLPHVIPEARLIEAMADADVLLACYTPVTAKAIAAATRLRGIVKYGVGIDAIDIAAAKHRSITVVNIPTYAEQTVAEAAFALIIALARRLPALHRHMQQHGWAWPEPAWIGSDIAGQTIGIVGLGRIGRSLARMAGCGFRARVVAFDPCVSAADMEALGVVKLDTLDDLMATADAVAVLAVLDSTTRGMIGARELALMKPTAVLVNVSRGAIIDETALVEALLEHRIAGAGLDVFDDEPLARKGHPLSDLYGMPNVILTPHLAFYTRQAMARLERETLERCRELVNGKPVRIRSTDSRLAGQANVTYIPAS